MSTIITAADIEIGDLIRVVFEHENFPEPVRGVVRGLHQADKQIDVSIDTGTVSDVGRDTTHVKIKLYADRPVELLARESVIASADYQYFLGDGQFFPVGMEIVRRGGRTYLRMRGMFAVSETEFRDRDEFEAIMPDREDGAEIGYLTARRALLEQYDAMR